MILCGSLLYNLADTDVQCLSSPPTDNLTLWTSDMQDSEQKPAEAPAAEGQAAEAKGEEAA